MRQDGITFITAEWIFACVSSGNPHPFTAALRKPACVSSTNPHPLTAVLRKPEDPHGRDESLFRLVKKFPPKPQRMDRFRLEPNMEFAKA